MARMGSSREKEISLTAGFETLLAHLGQPVLGFSVDDPLFGDRLSILVLNGCTLDLCAAVMSKGSGERGQHFGLLRDKSERGILRWAREVLAPGSGNRELFWCDAIVWGEETVNTTALIMYRRIIFLYHPLTSLT